jgi:hypothetical protein
MCPLLPGKGIHRSPTPWLRLRQRGVDTIDVAVGLATYHAHSRLHSGCFVGGCVEEDQQAA